MIRIPVKIAQGTAVETSVRQLRHLPNGQWGVLVDGIIFPVDAAGFVNLEGRSFYPRDCPPALEMPEQFFRMAERSAILHCHIEVSPHGYSMLHLDGSDVQLSRVVAALDAQDLQLDCFGAGYRPADNQQRYDWFVRFKDSSVDPWKVVSCINNQEPPDPIIVLDARTTEFGARLARIGEALSLSEAQLAEQEASQQHSLDTISVQAAMLRAAMDAQRERADAEAGARTRLAKEVEKLASELSTGRGRAEDSDAVRLLKQQLDEALAGWLDADASTNAAEAARRDAEEQLRKLQEALTKAQSDRPVAPPKSRRSRLADLETSFPLLLPNLVFLRDSLRFAAEQVFDLRALLTLLTRLNVGSVDTLEGKKLRDASGWWECHFSTGQGRDGRLYYRLLGGGVRNAYQVMISDKLAQNRDLDWLRRN